MTRTGTLAAVLCLGASLASAADRFPALQPGQMSGEQKAVADAILAGPTRSLAGPFQAWLRSPALAERLQELGRHLHLDTSLPDRLNEFAVLITVREWNSHYAWFAHHALAMKAGLEPAVAADLAAGRRPAAMTEDERVVYEFSTELHRTRTVSDKTYEAALAAFGERGVMDLIAVNGYYDLVCMTLNVAEVQVPAGAPDPLPAGHR